MEEHYQYQNMARVIEYLRHNYQNQPDLDELADLAHMSKFHFQRTFRKWVGLSPKEFLQITSLQHAKKLLAEGLSTVETAYETGLSGNSRLHDLFVKIEACTPGDFKNGGRDLRILLTEIETPFGTAAVAETPRGVCNLHFGPLEELKKLLPFPQASLEFGKGENTKKIENFFRTRSLPKEPIGLYLAGSAFQIQVWRALLHIPFTHLAAYSQVAEFIGKPQAHRAVGTAIGKNPVAYLIPCHRVIKNSGEFGNYRWDAGRKLLINSYEKAILPTEQVTDCVRKNLG